MTEIDKKSPTQQLHNIGQRLWLDNITRDMLNNGTLENYINTLTITGLTSNPSIFEQAVKNSSVYDEAIIKKSIPDKTLSSEELEEIFFDLAIDDLGRAADFFKPMYETSDGLDGWVSLEVSPLLANDADTTQRAAVSLHKRANRANLFIKIPGTKAGIVAIEETIYSGIPVNVTLLFSVEHYVAAAEAYMRGIERRLSENLDPNVACVASLFISRWDVAANKEMPKALKNRLGINVALKAYKTYCELLESERWQKLSSAGALPQRLLWASTGTKDPEASDVMYVEALETPNTINTLPEKTLLAFADHGEIVDTLKSDLNSVENTLSEFANAGIDVNALAAKLQEEGTVAFVKSWHELLACIASKTAALTE
ncbi:MAG: transaldolase [Cellvibrionaceae bacterium]